MLNVPQPRDYIDPREDTGGPSAVTWAGQMAIVTGASSGIGRAIARELAGKGASLCLLGRRPEALRELAQMAEAHGATGVIYEVDLAERQEMETLASRLALECGQADVLVHSAGIVALGSTEASSAADLDRQLNVNVRAPYVLTQALLPALKSRQGQIVFINSSAGLYAGENSGQYAASKHALKAVADSLRQEVNASGVRVLNIFVGRTATPMQAAVHAAEGRRYVPHKLIQPEDVASVTVHALSLPRTVEVTAIHLRPMTRPDEDR